MLDWEVLTTNVLHVCAQQRPLRPPQGLGVVSLGYRTRRRKYRMCWQFLLHHYCILFQEIPRWQSTVLQRGVRRTLLLRQKLPCSVLGSPLWTLELSIDPCPLKVSTLAPAIHAAIDASMTHTISSRGFKNAPDNGTQEQERSSAEKSQRKPYSEFVGPERSTAGSVYEKSEHAVSYNLNSKFVA